MNYKLKTPCNECPFLRTSGFTYASLAEHASGPFGCHKACNHDEETGDFVPHEKTPHCAGALIFRELQGDPHVAMRFAEYLGLYDPGALDMGANVGSRPSDYRREHAYERRLRERLNEPRRRK